MNYFKSYILYSLFPFAVLLPDILYIYVKSIYFPDVTDIIIYNQQKYTKEMNNYTSSESPIPVVKIKSAYMENNGIKVKLETENDIISNNLNQSPNKTSEKDILKKNKLQSKNSITNNISAVSYSLNENMDFAIDEGKSFLIIYNI